MVKHYYQEIPGWFDFQDIYRDMVVKAENGAVFVEVGNFLGKSLAFLATEIVNSGKDIKLFSVDHMARFFVPSDNKEVEHAKALAWSGFYLRDILERNLLPCIAAGLQWQHYQQPSDITIRRAVNFVFLDACHDRVGTGREIEAWWPYVTPGGFLGGHDHTTDYPGVKEAVSELLPHAKVIGNSFLVEK